MKRVSPPELLREFNVSVAEHQVLLSFVDDEDAELFDEWWHRDGLSLYSRWIDSLRGATK
jgi:hypothetical protein